MKKRIKRSFIVLLFAIVLLTTLCILAEIKILPKSIKVAEQQAKSTAELAISNVVFEELEKMNIAYDDFMIYEKGTDDKISAIKTNVVLLNKLKSILSIKINDKLKKNDFMDLKIPLGTLTGSSLFSGRGPQIKIKYYPVGSVTTDIKSVFESAGINQTKHQISLDIRAELSVLMPFKTVNANIATTVVIAETIIVGDIPSYIWGKN